MFNDKIAINLNILEKYLNINDISIAIVVNYCVPNVMKTKCMGIKHKTKFN